MVRGSIQLMKDVLARVSLTGAAPAIAQLGVGPTEAEARRLLLHNWPEATVRVADASRAALLARKRDCPLSFACEDVEAFAGGEGNESFDLIIATSLDCTAETPVLASRLLKRVRPGGVLAVQMDLRDDALAVAVDMGHGDALPPRRPRPFEGGAFFDALLGPLCSELDVWSSTYTHRCADGDAAWELLRQRSVAPVLDALRAAGAPAGPYERECRERMCPRPRPDGSVLLPLRCAFLVASRPGLLDIYQEYASYHDHQLEKGWKS